jgi:hypothetical protein
MPAVRLPPWRRLINALLLGCFLAFIGEIPVADVHDGDASASEVAHADQLAGHSHSESVQPGDTEAGSTGHNLHVCHCTHSHLSCIPAPEGAGAETPFTLTSVSSSSHDAPSVDPAPALRPPIA